MAAEIQFPNTYQESRAIFLEQFQTVKTFWPTARLESRSVSSEDDHRIEWIAADALANPKKVLIITCGLHGMEGFVGAAMRSLLLDEFLESLDPETTGLYLVHAINPWGMQNLRRVSRNNIDLNRNFILDPVGFQQEINLDYGLYDHILNPDYPLRPLWIEGSGLILDVAATLLKTGVKTLRNVVLQGQRSNPTGLYFSGTAYEPETIIVMDLIKDIFGQYSNALLIDMHTGYGPKYQMIIINSPQEKRTAQQMKAEFDYPLVLKADPDDFYIMQGDMVDWLYSYRESAGLEGKFYGVGFEFGTIGNNIPHELISLWNMIFENQAFWHGAANEKVKTRVLNTFKEMYFPTAEAWRCKALADCRQALQGVLSQEGYIA